MESLSDVVLQADKSAFKAKKIGGPLPGNKLGAKNGARGLRDAMQMETLDFNKKILHASWHPRENTIAVRFLSSFRCDRIVDIHRARLDRCNEQLVLIQRCMKFGVVLGSVVALSPLVAPSPFVVSSFVSSILQYNSRSPLFPFLTLSHTLPRRYCPLPIPPFVLVQVFAFCIHHI